MFRAIQGNVVEDAANAAKSLSNVNIHSDLELVLSALHSYLLLFYTWCLTFSVLFLSCGQQTVSEKKCQAAKSLLSRYEANIGYGIFPLNLILEKWLIVTL